MDLQQISDGLADALEHVGEGVVTVKAGRKGSGTGIIWDPDHVVAASHGLKRSEVSVWLADGSEREGQVIARDRSTDLALIRVTPGGLQPAARRSEPVRVGHLVLAVGRPFGDLTATFGLVSRSAGPWRTFRGARVDSYIEVDAVLPRGFSGGPLVDGRGEVIGMNTSRLDRGGATLPNATVDRVVARLLSQGESAPGYLGLGTQSVALPAATATAVGQGRALLVVSIEPGGPGEAANIQLGDALTQLGDDRVETLGDLIGTLDSLGSGTEVEVALVRAGAEHTVKITLGTRPSRTTG